MTPFYRFAARGAIIPFLKMVSRQKVTGLENIPREGGFIAVANHLTDLDSLTAMRALVDADVPVYSLAKSTLFKVPVLGSILRAGGQIPVQRGTQNAATALKAASEVLAGLRPVDHLVRWTSPSLFEALARRAGLAARILGGQSSPRRPRIRSVRTELTMSGACEATVLLEEGNRVRAAAARLELLRERWILTGLEMA